MLTILDYNNNFEYMSSVVTILCKWVSKTITPLGNHAFLYDNSRPHNEADDERKEYKVELCCISKNATNPASSRTNLKDSLLQIHQRPANLPVFINEFEEVDYIYSIFNRYPRAKLHWVVGTRSSLSKHALYCIFNSIFLLFMLSFKQLY